MPFARRQPRSFGHRLRDMVWPALGLRRLLKVYWIRLHRLPDSPQSVAAGFGWGLAISITPLLGGHMILSALMARLTKSSVVAALIATFLVNPWTGPPIWLATYYLGRFLEGRASSGRIPSFVAVFRGMTDAIWSLDGAGFAREVWPVFKPMLLGSLPLALAAWVTAYLLLVPVLVRLRAARIAPAIHH